MTTPAPEPATRRQIAAVLAVLGLVIGLVELGVVGPVFVLGQHTPGTVVEEKEDSKGTCAPVLAYQAGGGVHRAVSGIRFGSDCGWEEGQKVTVHYWADEPGNPVVISAASLVGLSAVPVVLFLAALWFAFVKPLPEAPPP